ncbi:MAG: DUF89 family protein, partial [Candidatus Eisenbacteria bacterium]|nr:DUF89 family protein [Candidatus Eisenbacteria bacterium]
MRTSVDCVPCFMDQALRAARMASDDPSVHEEVVRAVSARVADFDLSKSPPEMGRVIHDIVRRTTGDTDPYAGVKRAYTQAALELLPELEQLSEASDDRLETAVRIAIAGNIIDLGSNPDLRPDSLRRSLESALDAPLDAAGLERLRELAGSAEDILYIGDNAGETVFDRVLLRELAAERVTYAVRGRPVINDATRDDAEAAGLGELVRIIDNGWDVPGTILSQAGDAFRDLFDRADLVIAKGQGNYETLSGVSREVVFLLRVKCPVIAR